MAWEGENAFDTLDKSEFGTDRQNSKNLYKS